MYSSKRKAAAIVSRFAPGVSTGAVPRCHETRRLVVGCVVASALLLGACSKNKTDERCPKGKPPAPFSEVLDELPDTVAFCKDKYAVDFPAAGEPLPDGNKPNRAKVRWAEASPHDTFLSLIKHFEGNGWKRVEQNNELKSVTFSKGGHTLEVESIHDPSGNMPAVVNTPEAFGHLKVKKKPCDKPGRPTNVCDAQTRVRCFDGWPVETEDCAASNQRCVVEGRVSKCVPKR